MILVIIMSRINHSIPYPNFLLYLLNNAVMMTINKLPMERNIPIGNTLVNLLSSLSAWSDCTPKNPFVGFHMKSSPKRRKNPKGTIASAIEKNKISIRIFLFSYLLIFFINHQMLKNNPINNPTK